MRFEIPRPKDALVQFLRRIGYAPHRSRGSFEISYVRRLGVVADYPRFHLYCHETPQAVILNLHLDQKRPSYEGSRAHSGEYDGRTVEQERDRILNAATTSRNATTLQL